MFCLVGIIVNMDKKAVPPVAIGGSVGFFATFPLVSLPGHLLQRLLGVRGSVQWELRRSPSASLKSTR